MTFMTYDIELHKLQHYGYQKNCINQTNWSMNKFWWNILSKIQEIIKCHFFLCILNEKLGFPATVVPVDWERNFSHIITICMQCNGGKQRANSKSNFWYLLTTLLAIFGVRVGFKNWFGVYPWIYVSFNSDFWFWLHFGVILAFVGLMG